MSQNSYSGRKGGASRTSRTQNKRKEETEKTQVEKLKAQNRRLEKENKRLKSQQKNLKKALSKTLHRVEDLTEYHTLEHILQEVSDGEDEET